MKFMNARVMAGVSKCIKSSAFNFCLQEFQLIYLHSIAGDLLYKSFGWLPKLANALREFRHTNISYLI